MSQSEPVPEQTMPTDALIAILKDYPGEPVMVMSRVEGEPRMFPIRGTMHHVGGFILINIDASLQTEIEELANAIADSK